MYQAALLSPSLLASVVWEEGQLYRKEIKLLGVGPPRGSALTFNKHHPQ